MASGHVNRAQRPNTWLHRPMLHSCRKSLPTRSRPHSRGYRTRQQDRRDGVGDDGQGRTLQRASRARGLNGITPGIRRDVKVGRANRT